MSKLKCPSSAKWLEAVFSDFDAFLLDHASCERKASAMALSFVSHYPDRVVLVQEMMVLAREELEHFHQMLWLTQAKGLTLLPAEKDLYVQNYILFVSIALISQKFRLRRFLTLDMKIQAKLS